MNRMSRELPPSELCQEVMSEATDHCKGPRLIASLLENPYTTSGLQCHPLVYLESYLVVLVVFEQSTET